MVVQDLYVGVSHMYKTCTSKHVELRDSAMDIVVHGDIEVFGFKDE